MTPYHALIQIHLLVLAALVGCGKQDIVKPDKSEPAHVARHVDESELNTITLTPRAETRLGIQLAEVRLTEVRRKRTLGGEVMLPPGQTIVVTAPIAGTLELPAEGQPAAPGNHIAKGQALLRFIPLLSAERDVLTPSERVRMAQSRADIATAQLEAQRQVESAKVGVEAAQIALDRASQLLRAKAGSKRAVDEAEIQLKLAKETKQTADQRFKFLSGIELDEAAGQLESRTIQSPVDGVLQGLEAAPGETVAAGDVLFRVIKIDRVWVRVPVYVGQWREIDTSQPAMIAEFGQVGTVDSRPAQYVSAPPSADPHRLHRGCLLRTR
jgi:multidrug efflux pump subunit AcrA (membrane-fusion protein)